MTLDFDSRSLIISTDTCHIKSRAKHQLCGHQTKSGRAKRTQLSALPATWFVIINGIPLRGLPEIFGAGGSLRSVHGQQSREWNHYFVTTVFKTQDMESFLMSQASKLGLYLCHAKKKDNNNQKLISAPKSKNNNHTQPLAEVCFSVSPGPCDLSATIQLKTNNKAYLRFWQVKENPSWSKDSLCQIGSYFQPTP